MNPEFKVCPRCGQQFACHSYNVMKCACIQISLDHAAREKIASQYDDCLCISCLKEYAEPSKKSV